jgi:predicted nucleotidyltransferase
MPRLTTPPAIPAGTQVVVGAPADAESDLPPDAVGVVVAAPSQADGTYIVRFPDGREATLRREQLRIRKLHQRGALAALPGIDELRPYIIYRCVIGSRAYGLATEASDTDRRGIYLPPARLHWALAGVPEQIEDHRTEECYWELQKFLTLALKANPNVLECLSTPIVEHADPLTEELLAMRSAFLSKLIYQTYNGYVMSQFRRLEQDLRVHGAIKHKHAMHLIRLLLSGITALREGFVPVDVGAYRDRLLAIKRGELPWEEVDAWRLALHQSFDAAYAATPLPDQPDYARADAFLLRARRARVAS